MIGLTLFLLWGVALPALLLACGFARPDIHHSRKDADNE